MAKIKDLLNRAKSDMQSNGRLSKGTYYDVVDSALRGEAFELRMGVADAYKCRARMTYYHKAGVMHMQTLEDGTAQVSFNK